MLEAIIEFDKELMLAINGCTNAFLDIFMPFITHRYTGIPIYIGLLVLIIHKWKGDVKTIAVMISAVVLTFALSDSLSVALFKDTVQRLRPGWDPQMEQYVRMLEYKGGKYGFVSSHAANLFGLATITYLILKKRWFTISIFSFAAVVGYSRVYVGKHYPLDVICGAIFGVAVSFIIYKLVLLLCMKLNLHPWDKSTTQECSNQTL
ncbi:MAG: phosphatase PAP2 family protein [Bacteroidales bacterium]|nr:phosphatase PAP2 family protein [Bacteroidales bacterium]